MDLAPRHLGRAQGTYDGRRHAVGAADEDVVVFQVIDVAREGRRGQRVVPEVAPVASNEVEPGAARLSDRTELVAEHDVDVPAAAVEQRQLAPLRRERL